MRFYGFDQKELTTPDQPNLSLKQDPKLSWALRHREFFPLDVNAGSKAALLRVPGLGVRNVERILRIRRHHRITLDDLRRLHVPLTKAAPFLITADANAATRNLDRTTLPSLVAPPTQLALFETVQTARTGEL